MIATASLASPRQARPGAVIRLSASFMFDNDGWDAETAVGYGVTPTSSTPTNISSFAHTVSTLRDSQWTFTDSQRIVAGADASHSVIQREVGTLPVDSNFVAGHYLWAYTAGAAGAIVGHSAGYLIR